MSKPDLSGQLLPPSAGRAYQQGIIDTEALSPSPGETLLPGEMDVVDEPKKQTGEQGHPPLMIRIKRPRPLNNADPLLEETPKMEQVS